MMKVDDLWLPPISDRHMEQDAIAELNIGNWNCRDDDGPRRKSCVKWWVEVSLSSGDGQEAEGGFVKVVRVFSAIVDDNNNDQ